MPYYGVYIPGKAIAAAPTNNGFNSTNCIALPESVSNINIENDETDVSEFVSEQKSAALSLLKNHKDARFKEFLSKEEAIQFAKTGFEIVQNKYNDVKTSTESLEKAAFRAPTKEQLVHLRKNIENDNWKFVKKLVWDNPRYLVSSGDTPTILKEGYRYNAMHVCAASQSPKVARLILETVSDQKFADLLMGKKNDEKLSKELCANLLDYYLNMPEKGRMETPLHFAAKFGHVYIVEILLSYPECKMLRNIHGFLAKDIICDRKNGHLHEEIEKLFEERFYVPVLRSNDGAIPGKIGEPFSVDNPPNLNCDPLTPDLEVKALAGPMSEEKAKKFFRRWKTPPRIGTTNVSSPNASNIFISPMKSYNKTPSKTPHLSNNRSNSFTANIKKCALFNSTPVKHDQNGVINLNGLDKSMHGKSHERNEAVGNTNECSFTNNNHAGNLSKTQINMFKTSLFPQTPLFKLKKNAFTTYRDEKFDSPFVHTLGCASGNNDSLFNSSDLYDSPGFKERHVKNTDIEKGLECIGRFLAKEENIEWREYWDFFEEFVDIASDEGIKKLEDYLGQRQKEQEKHNETSISIQKPNTIDDFCNAFKNSFGILPTVSATTEHGNSTTKHQSLTAYTYVERSLQVHAKRMTKTIIHNMDNEVSIIDALLSELRRVKSLIFSFKQDESFANVNFEKVHSRIGNLISTFLTNSQEVSQKIKCNILIVLQNICLEQYERREHMECICSRIVECLQQPDEQTAPENIKTEEICSKIWSEEKDCTCQWESNFSRKTSRRIRNEDRYQRHWLQKQQEKLPQDLKHQQAVKNIKNCQKATTTDSSDEEEVYWSDFSGFDSNDDEDEIFFTPKQSPSLLSLSDDEDANKIFIFGNEPTKRDLDVLNAIFHLSIDKTKYPHIHSWKDTIMRYPNEEKDLFPSPRTVKKSHSFVATSFDKKDLFVQPQTPTSTKKSYSIIRSNTCSMILNSPSQQSTLASATRVPYSNNVNKMEPILQLPMAKRLFMSPGRTKSMSSILIANNNNLKDNVSNSSVTTATAVLSKEDNLNMPIIKQPIKQQFQTQRPLTPLNKLKGLFSAYRECLDNSSTSGSSTSP